MEYNYLEISQINNYIKNLIDKDYFLNCCVSSINSDQNTLLVQKKQWTQNIMRYIENTM